MKKATIAVATAFAGRVPDVEKFNGEIEGYEGTDTHPHLPTINPTFRFIKDAFLTLCYAWRREWSRTESDPRRGVWWGGPKGVGKTTLTEQFFARIGVPVTSITCNRRIPLSDYISKLVPDGEGGWMTIPGVLTVAMQQGYPVILNEPSSMDPADLIAMHDIIDRGLLVKDDGEVITAARGFLVFATDNSMGFGDMSGAYAGVNTMNQATMSRFLKFDVDYPTEAEEQQILVERFPDQAPEFLGEIVKFANAMRAPARSGQSMVTMGTREVIDLAECAAYFHGLTAKRRSPVWFAFQRVMGGIPPVEMEAAKATFQSVFGVDVSNQ